jgi:hypothetical protein
LQCNSLQDKYYEFLIENSIQGKYAAGNSQELVNPFTVNGKDISVCFV